jgi:uncharacterized protein (TIGR02246 family)
MIRFALILVLAALSAYSAIAHEPAPNSQEEAAIREVIARYVVAFNSGDGKSVAAFWTEDGEYVGPSGERLKGRDKIEAALEKFFKEDKGVQIEVEPSDISLTGPENAVEKGSAVVSFSDKSSTESNYLVKYVKLGEDWKIVSACETLKASNNYEHLKQLEWLIGQWVDKQENSKVELVCEWSENKNFITVSFVAQVSDCVTLEGTQVIGWDASAKKMKSWVFDSLGGFGEGIWSGKSPQWTVKTSAVLSDGGKVSATDVYTLLDQNTFAFRSTNRKVAGTARPNIDEVKIVRKETQK